MIRLFSLPSSFLLAAMLFVGCLPTAYAGPITIGSLSSNDDGSTQVIADSLNDLEWLRWDEIANLNYADTVIYAAANGWSIAHNAEAQWFVSALAGPHACISQIASSTDCAVLPNTQAEMNALTGDNFGVVSNFAFFLNDANAVDAGYLALTVDLDGTKFTARINNVYGSISATDAYADAGNNAQIPISWLLYRNAQVPEPSTLGLLGLGLLGLGFARQRKA